MAPDPQPAQCAVLIDGSALFFAIRETHPDESLDYPALLDLLCEKFGERDDQPKEGEDARLLKRPDLQAKRFDLPNRPIWLMWTAAMERNEGQMRFLNFIEEKVGIDTRRFSPSDSLMIDPLVAAAGSANPHVMDRLTRFDAGIGYMIGRLALTHQLIVVSDSFALAEPLVRADYARAHNPLVKSGPRNVLAFFGKSLDSRWHELIRTVQHEDAIHLLDFDEFDDRLFGRQKKLAGEGRRRWWTWDMPGNPSKSLRK